MKQIILFSLLFVLTISAYAQKKPVKKAPAKKPAPAVVASSQTTLKNLSDSASYSLGINIATSLNKDLNDLNFNLVMKGMKDVFDKKPFTISEEESINVLNEYSAKAREEKLQKTIDEERAFFEKNKSKSGVFTTATGLQYEVVKDGTGAKPTANDTVICHYRGTLLDGTEFDQSYERGEPLTIPVSAVIKGWTEGLQLMNVGSKFKFYIPYELGYGLHGAPPAIPPASALIFEVELLQIKKGS